MTTTVLRRGGAAVLLHSLEPTPAPGTPEFAAALAAQRFRVITDAASEASRAWQPGSCAQGEVERLRSNLQAASDAHTAIGAEVERLTKEVKHYGNEWATAVNGKSVAEAERNELRLAIRTLARELARGVE